LTATYDDICGVVLAGGLATRMGGGEKALVELGGQSLIERVLSVLGALFPELIIVTPRPQALAQALAQARIPGNALVVEDRHDTAGPLGGIHAGLSVATLPHAFVTACDMPFLSKQVIAEVVSHRTRADIVVPRIEDRDQTLHAVYATSLAGSADRILAEGGGSPRDLGAECRVHRLGAADFEAISGWERSFWSIDTQESLARAESEIE